MVVIGFPTHATDMYTPPVGVVGRATSRKTPGEVDMDTVPAPRGPETYPYRPPRGSPEKQPSRPPQRGDGG